MSGKRGKTDAADATAICDAVQRPDMRFVPVKSEGTSKPGYAYTGTAKALSNSAPLLSAGGHPLDCWGVRCHLAIPRQQRPI